ncbi:hypothetical protein P775_28475 [Puniceibacterium antarcticum]|uniref:ABC transmembrane type-1 domain-containing protein n=1 Tax=Puniceibacterium antarcticum TaxID=1206336 RepID=A0A2G8QT24_9RHOB|nr:hypothetical protein [Puniceibacterium antarcticum]PIL12442.1 hypothetical protein P775_28475 [Puniceibacterium antarcticum]
MKLAIGVFAMDLDGFVADVQRSRRSRPRNILLYGFVAAVLVFFYIPIATQVLFSFTESRFLSWPIQSFSTRWFSELLADRDFWRASSNSALLAICATLFATLLGIGGDLSARIAADLCRGRDPQGRCAPPTGPPGRTGLIPCRC